LVSALEGDICEPLSNFALNFNLRRYKEGPQHLAFTIPIFEPMPPQYFLRATHESWLGCETFLELNFQGREVIENKHSPDVESKIVSAHMYEH
jgi:hypothetical protein